MQRKLVVMLCLLVSGIAGCQTPPQEKAARQWCYTIRACQVIPVYPLTEDIQPGDVFLVTASASEESASYKKKGFLPLPMHMTRLDLKGYDKFYGERYGIGGTTAVPEVWQKSDNGWNKEHQWLKSPQAAFPTYTFTVDANAGAYLGLPVQGVPVGLTLLGAKSGHGTVTVTDAYTYGLDGDLLLEDVYKWGESQRWLLSAYQPEKAGGHPKHYLRVVYRVYAAGAMNVEVVGAEGYGVGATAGVSKLVDALTAGDTEEAKKITSGINGALDQSKGVGGTGGSLRFVTGSTTSVTLQQTFNRPLVLGYVGFDLPILDEGALGAPVDTNLKIQKPRAQAMGEPIQFGADEYSDAIFEWCKVKENRDNLDRWLSDNNYPALSDVRTGARYSDIRKKIVDHFGIPVAAKGAPK